MNPGVTNVLNLPFVQVTLPILIGMFATAWQQNKRLDRIIRQLDDYSSKQGNATVPRPAQRTYPSI